MDLRSIYVANGIGIFLLLFLMYTSRTKIQARTLEGRIYNFMVWGVMIGCFMEAFSYWLDGRLFPGSRVLNYIANTYLFSVNVILPFCVVMYVDLGLYGDPGRIWKHYKPQIIIGIIMILLTLANLFVPLCYYISEQNVYERRLLGNFYYAVILYFCVTGIILTRRYEKDNGARAFFSINMFLVPILIGTALQFIFYGLSLAWLSAAMGLVGLFMMQQNELAYVDSLVDTYNRQYLNHIFAAWTARGKTFSGVMLDIDRFKGINDNFGHSEGDKALKTIADTLKSARLDHEWVFRFAGDEFVVLKMGDAATLSAYMDEVDRRLEKVNREKHDYLLRISYGISTFKGGSLDDFMKEMDSNMYSMKAKHHKVA